MRCVVVDDAIARSCRPALRIPCTSRTPNLLAVVFVLISSKLAGLIKYVVKLGK